MLHPLSQTCAVEERSADSFATDVRAARPLSACGGVMDGLVSVGGKENVCGGEVRVTWDWSPGSHRFRPRSVVRKGESGGKVVWNRERDSALEEFRFRSKWNSNAVSNNSGTEAVRREI